MNDYCRCLTERLTTYWNRSQTGSEECDASWIIIPSVNISQKLEATCPLLGLLDTNTTQRKINKYVTERRAEWKAADSDSICEAGHYVLFSQWPRGRTRSGGEPRYDYSAAIPQLLLVMATSVKDQKRQALESPPVKEQEETKKSKDHRASTDPTLISCQ